MGLLSAAGPKGAMRAGPKRMIGTCQGTVKRKSVDMCPYPSLNQCLMDLTDFRLWIGFGPTLQILPGSARTRHCRVCQPPSDRGGPTSARRSGSFVETRLALRAFAEPRTSCARRYCSSYDSGVPSPVGHGLAALAVGWAVAGRATSARGAWAQAATFVAVGIAPDLDLLWGRHSAETHSIGAAAIVASIAAWRRWPAAVTPSRIWLAVFLAWCSHPLLDAIGPRRHAAARRSWRSGRSPVTTC